MLVGSGALVSCQDDTEHFDNKIYNTAEQTSTVFVEEEADSYVRTLQAQLAMPADSDISFAYVADPGQVEWYNTAYSDSAGMLPADYYEIPDPEAVIPAGETASSEVEIRFRNLLSLDKTQVYVLPVSIDGADVATLASRRTVYFVVKEASLVNVVANLRENAVSVEWRNPDPLRNLHLRICKHTKGICHLSVQNLDRSDLQDPILRRIQPRGLQIHNHIAGRTCCFFHRIFFSFLSYPSSSPTNCSLYRKTYFCSSVIRFSPAGNRQLFLHYVNQ